jgi:hypothetical protein
MGDWFIIALPTLIHNKKKHHNCMAPDETLSMVTAMAQRGNIHFSFSHPAYATKSHQGLDGNMVHSPK